MDLAGALQGESYTYTYNKMGIKSFPGWLVLIL